MPFLVLSFCILFCGFTLARPVPGSQDHYNNFSELASANVEGKDYSIIRRDNPSRVLVMSFHGGLIEPGTTELGTAVAGDLFDFYTFLGNKNDEHHEESLTASDLHLTSARFDEPQLLAMVSDSDFCVSLHGFGGSEADFCVGGSNAGERKRLVETLSKHFPDLRSCELCCPPYNGTSLKNPVNKCRNAGVQVEMSPRVRRAILQDESFRKSAADSFRVFLLGRM